MDIGLRVLLWAMRGPISTSRSIRSKASFLLGLHLPPLARAVSTGLSVHKIIGSEINLYFARKVIDEHKDDGKVSYRTNIQSVSQGRSHLLIRKILRIRMTERKLQQDRTTVSSGNLPSLRCFEAESTYLYIDLNTVHQVIEGPKDNKAFLQSQEKTKGKMGGLFLNRLSNRFLKKIKIYLSLLSAPELCAFARPTKCPKMTAQRYTQPISHCVASRPNTAYQLNQLRTIYVSARSNQNPRMK